MRLLFCFLCFDNWKICPFFASDFRCWMDCKPPAEGTGTARGMLADSPSSHNQQNNTNMEETTILMRLEAIERYSLLAAKNVLTIDDAAVLTGLSKSHLYKLTCSKQIPFYRPNGKLVYFDRQELEGWLKQNRVNTTAEAEQAALTYVMRNKK